MLNESLSGTWQLNDQPDFFKDKGCGKLEISPSSIKILNLFDKCDSM